MAAKRRPVIASPEQQQRVVALYRSDVKSHEIYDMIFSYLDEPRTYNQKVSYIQMILQRAGCIRDSEQRGRIARGNRKPKQWKSKSKWSMR